MNTVTGIVFVHAVLFGIVYSNTCNTFQISQENNKVLVGHSMLEINKTTSHRECAQTCMSFSICKSIDYDRKGKKCMLNDVDKSSDDHLEFAVKNGSVFSNINEWPNVSIEPYLLIYLFNFLNNLKLYLFISAVFRVWINNDSQLDTKQLIISVN